MRERVLSAKTEGVHDLTLRVNGQTVTKQISVGQESLAKISPARVGGGWLDELEHPGEPPIAAGSAVKMIEVLYPAGRWSFFGWQSHWLLPYFALSVVFGLALKGFFGVEI